MEVLCFDLEGVFVPEIWINVAAHTGVEALKLTTRDVPDYDELMTYRLRTLDDHGLGIAEIQSVIASMEPMPGAREFLEWTHENFQVVILSDTFYQFAEPLMRQLGFPTLFCHNLEIGENNRIVDYHLRLPRQKEAAIRAFQGLNFTVFAVGDSYNDTGMLLAAEHGFLFKPPQNVIDEFPQLPVVTSYDQLKTQLIEASSREIA
ncbi:MAG: bifunctional phosphoserine phosphatase/homoserine phosphotransferase ThrH [Propionibacteriaceae bacterium]|jgi:phosphoserine/homoserine phosphotransferase|nr:bifunctional phosphoserine phosphatase/homoserine phosphotransferase ThrH [Propionibacteriaceae bacterium]